jgi:hypothetical protein
MMTWRREAISACRRTFSSIHPCSAWAALLSGVETRPLDDGVRQGLSRPLAARRVARIIRAFSIAEFYLPVLTTTHEPCTLPGTLGKAQKYPGIFSPHFAACVQHWLSLCLLQQQSSTNFLLAAIGQLEVPLPKLN